MRSINLSDHENRDSPIGFQPVTPESETRYVLASGDPATSVKVIKNTFASHLPALQKKAEEAHTGVPDLIINGDPEIDFNFMGKISSRTKTIYLTDENDISYNVAFKEEIYAPSGEKMEVRNHLRVPSNISSEIPLTWTGKLMPIEKAIQRFVFTKIYQLHHVNGLTYDFLYRIAKLLHQKKAFAMVGAGPKGKEQLRFSRGGPGYFAFLHGRVKEETYRLTLHLTNLELKGIPQ